MRKGDPFFVPPFKNIFSMLLSKQNNLPVILLSVHVPRRHEVNSGIGIDYLKNRNENGIDKFRIGIEVC